MFPLDYILAVTLIVSPGNVTETESFENLRPTITAVAVNYELMDQNEATWLMSPYDMAYSINVIKHRYVELADAPPAQDSMIFPDRACLQELMNFNREYVRYLKVRLKTEAQYASEIEETIVECNRIHYVLDLVCDTKCGYYSVSLRRAKLKELQATIGYENYYAGILPPHVPVWRFKRID